MKSIALIALSCFVATTASAEDDPNKMVSAKYDEIQTIIKTDKSDESVRAKVAKVLQSFTDFRQFGKLTLKRDWKDLSDKQRDLFVQRYQLLIEKSYLKHFKANQKLEVGFRGEALHRKGKAKVVTTVKSGDTEADVDYKLHQLDGQWRAYDIVIDDVSLMRSYRKQFGKIMKRDGFDKLIEKMNQKIDKGTGDIEDP